MLLLLLLTSVLGTLSILLFIAIALDQQGGFEFFWKIDHIPHIEKYVILLFAVGVIMLLVSVYILLYILKA
ncbi:hypothetical protein MUA52_08175 [Staphylococcus agnetis]|uniref:Heme biosynthesis protein HemY n=1 Tax=Staphylococcus agnetis TaxID=985762 RepID=A0ABD7TSF4_9STAP|nr:hypothetical protein [Staphylococcus agnetis]UXU54235.1 hypothetical protein MUA11_07890 [Staphylococcus agnetis]UXU56489.1 hypothetical protein MUA95_07905 [Staphylococcus agnetis]UXU63519.1 hypothetical protein MUA84_08240 [Staphylococcus agnetis]UXU65801.1 hypothetical protein MUA52_08175 [Staphylococcus agnetis]